MKEFKKIHAEHFKVGKIFFCILLSCLLLSGCVARSDKSQDSVAQDTQHASNVEIEDAIENIFDELGVPMIEIEGAGKQYHPAYVGIYALDYAGENSFYNMDVEKNFDKFQNCINWLKNNVRETANGLYVWEYNFDLTYNDISVKAPWHSGFGQALAIEALLSDYTLNGDKESLELAKQGAEVLLTPISQGGVLFEDGEDIWFEEIPVPIENPSHILSGHMRALIALQKLYQVTNDPKYLEWYNRGAKTLMCWLPLYDAGYWLRYDLNPKKEELLFRFQNKYGYEISEIPIDSITLSDSVSGQSVTIDVGAQMDAQENEPRIAGIGWQAQEELDGRSVRRLLEAMPADVVTEQTGEFLAPYTYFYLDLPEEWKNNLRNEDLELIIVYKDEFPANLNVQMRSIASGDAFVDLKEGDLLLTGSGEWREWIIPINAADLGWWTENTQAEKHLQYLEWLAQYSSELQTWENIAEGYLNSVVMPDDIVIVEAENKQLPEQSVSLNLFSWDDNGVIRQHTAGEETVIEGGLWDFKSPGGEPHYSPFIIANQAISGTEFNKGVLFDVTTMDLDDDYWRKYNWVIDTNKIRKEPAYKWLDDNKIAVGDGVTWAFESGNAYNDMVQEPGWQSAFSQKYVIDAYMDINDEDTVLKAAYAYEYRTEEGGLASYDKSGKIWYEEVPNNSHILNAHLTSLVTLDTVAKAYGDERIEGLYEDGLSSLKENLYRYDTGYWTKYDMNPKKDFLLQIDWLDGDASPLISEILLYNPQTNTATQIDVGDDSAFDGLPNIAGMDWGVIEEEDGIYVRSLINGYLLHPEAVDGGTRHNVYIRAALPESSFDDYFEVPDHQLIIRYKDIAPGRFHIKSQAINEGNRLVFVEVPNSVIECVGDGQWKTAIIDIPVQAMGWFMGEDYQVFHNEQIGILAEQTGDIQLKQVQEKWEYYLECYQEDVSPIVNNNE